MQAAHDAAEIPLFIRQVFDRFEGAGDAGAKEDQQPDAADEDDPAKENRQRSEVVKRRFVRPERSRERSLQESEAGPASLLQESEQLQMTLQDSGHPFGAKASPEVQGN